MILCKLLSCSLQNLSLSPNQTGPASKPLSEDAEKAVKAFLKNKRKNPVQKPSPFKASKYRKPTNPISFEVWKDVTDCETENPTTDATRGKKADALKDLTNLGTPQKNRRRVGRRLNSPRPRFRMSPNTVQLTGETRWGRKKRNSKTTYQMR
tara:strand:- start:875 stop:1330 length:456 start_codon:yes stop_codon:yes gene_type:complete